MVVTDIAPVRSHDRAHDKVTDSDGGKRRALLEAAARIMAQEGPHAVSIRRLAAEVGSSTMAVYTWYGGKPNLMRAVYREAFVRFRDRLEAQPRGGDPLVDLIRLGRAYRDHALADPHLYAVMFGQHSSLFDPEPDDVVLAAGTFEVLVDAVGRCTDDGTLGGDPRNGAWQIWAAVHGVMSLELAHALPPGKAWSARDAYRGMVRTVLLGLGADPKRLDEALRTAGAKEDR